MRLQLRRAKKKKQEEDKHTQSTLPINCDHCQLTNTNLIILDNRASLPRWRSLAFAKLALAIVRQNKVFFYFLHMQFYFLRL
jgi:hypothetical protein